MIYTREGDHGYTNISGRKVSKDSPIVHQMGVIDELVCQIGLVRTEEKSPDINKILLRIQNELYWAASMEFEIVVAGAIGQMEKEIDLYSKEYEVSIPGADRVNALLHIARAICRRAERQLMYTSYATYLNRLSDLLFVLAEI